MVSSRNSRAGVLILSAPSGGGKTSLARTLVRNRQRKLLADSEKMGDATSLSGVQNVSITVSHTTRIQRPGERQGVDYHFVSKAKFEEMIENHEFIEFAQVFDHYYGTSILSIQNLLLNHSHAILDIDWQGARIVRDKFSHAVSVFVMPPSIEELEIRLRKRKQDAEETIARRMREAENEISHKDEFDIIIVNDDFDRALSEFEAILDSLPPASILHEI